MTVGQWARSALLMMRVRLKRTDLFPSMLSQFLRILVLKEKVNMNVYVANIFHPVLHMLFQCLSYHVCSYFHWIFIYFLLQVMKRLLSGGMKT